MQQQVPARCRPPPARWPWPPTGNALEHGGHLADAGEALAGCAIVKRPALAASGRRLNRPMRTKLAHDVVLMRITIRPATAISRRNKQMAVLRAFACRSAACAHVLPFMHVASASGLGDGETRSARRRGGGVRMPLWCLPFQARPRRWQFGRRRRLYRPLPSLHSGLRRCSEGPTPRSQAASLASEGKRTAQLRVHEPTAAGECF